MPPVIYGRNSMSDPDSRNDRATNDVDGECCALMETSIKSVCWLEIPEICKPRFSGALCLYVFRSDPLFMLEYSMRENSITNWFPPTFDHCQFKINVLYRFPLNILLC